VGFGFGPIQAGLFLYEAFRSGRFRRLVVAEVLPNLVSAVCRADGWYSLNVACSDRVEICTIGPIEIMDPATVPGRQDLIDAVAQAEEIATAVPTVGHYTSANPGSIHRILAKGLQKKAAFRGPRAVVYAAENHNHAAEILQASVFDEIPAGEHDAVSARVRFLNTVIGKMSRAVTDPREISVQGLADITPCGPPAFLVESFNRILISKIRFEEAGEEPAFHRGLAVFEEKENLLPFEEAKLYGHNATHALAAYVGAVRGLERIADVSQLPDMLSFLRAAFIQESGEALIRRHAGLDPLFTPQGYSEYADDLLKRMVNPYLGDTVERVGRDPDRKLGWDDRLVGTIRIALREGVVPRRYAVGAAAALTILDRSVLEKPIDLRDAIEPLWRTASPDEHEKQAVLRLIEDGRRRLKRWVESGFPDLEGLFVGDN